MRSARRQPLKFDRTKLVFWPGWHGRPHRVGDRWCNQVRRYAGHLSGSWRISVKKRGLKSKKGLTRAAHWQIKRPVVAFSQDIVTRIAAYLGAIAQLGERLLCKQEVVGSIPSGSTKFFIMFDKQNKKRRRYCCRYACYCDAATDRQRAPLKATLICKNKQKIKLLADRKISGNLIRT